MSNLTSSLGLEHVHLLLADIQGSEYKMLKDITPMLKARRISYLFVSLHAEWLGDACKRLLEGFGYRILAFADISQRSWAGDGVIIACPMELTQVAPVELLLL